MEYIAKIFPHPLSLLSPLPLILPPWVSRQQHIPNMTTNT